MGEFREQLTRVERRGSIQSTVDRRTSQLRVDRTHIPHSSLYDLPPFEGVIAQGAFFKIGIHGPEARPSNDFFLPSDKLAHDGDERHSERIVMRPDEEVKSGYVIAMFDNGATFADVAKITGAGLVGNEFEVWSTRDLPPKRQIEAVTNLGEIPQSQPSTVLDRQANFSSVRPADLDKFVMYSAGTPISGTPEEMRLNDGAGHDYVAHISDYILATKVDRDFKSTDESTRVAWERLARHFGYTSFESFRNVRKFPGLFPYGASHVSFGFAVNRHGIVAAGDAIPISDFLNSLAPVLEMQTAQNPMIWGHMQPNIRDARLALRDVIIPTRDSAAINNFSTYLQRVRKAILSGQSPSMGRGAFVTRTGQPVMYGHVRLRVETKQESPPFGTARVELTGGSAADTVTVYMRNALAMVGFLAASDAVAKGHNPLEYFGNYMTSFKAEQTKNGNKDVRAYNNRDVTANVIQRIQDAEILCSYVAKRFPHHREIQEVVRVAQKGIERLRRPHVVTSFDQLLQDPFGGNQGDVIRSMAERGASPDEIVDALAQFQHELDDRFAAGHY